MKHNKTGLRFRQIHLDFHTGPDIPDVGVDFDARAFARTMKEAHVDSVTLFAKCHHGHLYYNTKRPERHPGLSKSLNLLGEQVEALHRESIRAPIYLSVQCDEYAANTYPQWRATQPDGAAVKSGGVFAPAWQILDMSSPYQDFLAEQTQEVLNLFKPVDGIFFDLCWDQPSCSSYAIAGMVRRNLNPEKEEDRTRYMHDVAIAYMKRFHGMVRAGSANASIYFNSRPLHNLAEEVKYLEQVEIEALATGGWGYMYFPVNVRFARTFGKPYMGMTARFHKSWADFGGLKPAAALEYETLQSLAHGAGCSIGDQLHPRGVLDAATYQLIEPVYRQVEKLESYVRGSKPLTQIGVVPVFPGVAQAVTRNSDGVVRLLQQLRHQFDFVSEKSRWSDYELLILPDAVEVDARMASKLKAYVKQGGKLLATGRSGLSADGTQKVLDVLPVTPKGWSEYLETYFEFVRPVPADVPNARHVMYERGIRAVANKGVKSLAQVVDPYFQRAWNHFSSHFQTPDNNLTQFTAAVVHESIGYIPYPLFTAFASHGNYPYRLLLREVLNRLLPDPILTANGPTGLETSVAKQGSRTLVHLLFYPSERRTPTLDIIEDVLPIYGIDVTLKLSHKPKCISSALSGDTIDFGYADGRATFTVPEICGYQLIVINE